MNFSDHYTDAALEGELAAAQADIAARPGSLLAGRVRIVTQMLRIPAEHRATIASEVDYAMNMTGGRPSDHWHAFASNWSHYVGPDADARRARQGRRV